LFKDTPLTTLFTIGRDNAAMTKSIQSSTMAVANTFAFNGIEAVLVEVQVQIAPGLPALILVGLPDKAVGEARERVRAAFAAMGVSLPIKRVLINLKPADLLKEGGNFFKHADRDADEILEVDEKVNDAMIILALMNYRDLGCEATSELVAFEWWFFALHPDFLEDERKKAEVKSLGYHTATRADQLEFGRYLLTHGPGRK
jgi:hypothetical protein